MAELIGSMTMGMAADADPDRGEPGEQDAETCDTCGRELIDHHQMGQESKVCPNCDLL